MQLGGTGGDIRHSGVAYAKSKGEKRLVLE